MAIKSMSLRDAPAAARAVGASNARKQIQQLLGNPYLPTDQREELVQQLDRVAKWEALALPEVAAQAHSEPPPTLASVQREPQNHTIEVSESLAVQEH